MPPNGHMYGLNFTLKSGAESQAFMSAVYMYGLYLKQPEPICTVVSSLPLMSVAVHCHMCFTFSRLHFRQPMLHSGSSLHLPTEHLRTFKLREITHI